MSVVSIGTEQIGSRRVGVWTLQVIVALAFLAAGAAKLAGAPFMVQLFDQIGLGQWFRIATGVVEVFGAATLLHPRLASFGGLWLGFTMVCAVLTHLFVLHTNPAPAVVLGVLNLLIAYLRRNDFASLVSTITTLVREIQNQ
jgi:putative oxidoreductase